MEEGSLYWDDTKLVGFSVRKYSSMVDKNTKDKYSQQFVQNKEYQMRDPHKEG